MRALTLVVSGISPCVCVQSMCNWTWSILLGIWDALDRIVLGDAISSSNCFGRLTNIIMQSYFLEPLVVSYGVQELVIYSSMDNSKCG